MGSSADSASSAPSPLAIEVVALATGLGVRIAVAESLTGGLLAASIVAVPGASLAISGGIVAYDTNLKASLLGVDRALLRERGPVDAEVARSMARGVRAACAIPEGDAHVGVSTTGVAGPDPDPQTGQPAGTVWIGVSSARGERAVRLELVPPGDDTRSGTRPEVRSEIRSEIRDAAVRRALELLAEELRALAETCGRSPEPS